MRIITIGDLHGSSAWKSVNPDLWDYLVFIGDYVDSFEYSDKEISDNLNDVLELKRTQPAKVILLWGNHDLAYFYGGHKRHYCSGFRSWLLPMFYKVFTSSSHLFQSSFQIGNYLWTHAGIMNGWYQDYIRDEINPEDHDLSYTLNRLMREYYEPLYYVSAVRGGLNRYGGIFWADRTETLKDPLPGYHQVIGHTHVKKPETIKFNDLENTSVTYVDCLEYSDEFLELEI